MVWNSIDDAKNLLSNGLISQDQFNSVYGSQPLADPLNEIMPPPQPLGQTVQDPVMPAPAAQPEPSPAPLWGVPGLTAKGISNTINALTPTDPMLWNAPSYEPQAPPEQLTPALQPASTVLQPNTNDGMQLVPNAALPPIDPMRTAYDEAVGPMNGTLAAFNEASLAGQAAAMKESAFYEKQQKDFQDAISRQQKWEDDQTADLEKKRQDLDAYGEKMLSRKIDPQRFWADKSTAQKIAGAFAIALGGVSAGRGGNNVALDIINQAINRDIEAQKTDIASGRELYNMKAGLYGDMMNLFKDKRAAKLAAMENGLKAAQMGLNSIAARYKAPEIKAKYAALSAQIQDSILKTRMEFEKRIAERNAMVSIYTGQAINPESLPEDKRKRLVLGPGGKVYGLALGDEDAKTIRAEVGDIESGRDALDQLIKLGETTRGQKISPSLRAKAETLTKLVQAKLRTKIVGPGAMSESEWKIMDMVVDNPSAIFTLGNEVSKLQVLQKNVDDAWDRRLAANNLMRPELRERSTLQTYFQHEPVKTGGKK